MLQVASLTGIWGVSYIVWTVNLYIAHSIINYSRVKIASAAVVLSFIFLLGIWHFKHEEGDYAVAAIQTQTENLEKLADLNRRAGELGAKLAVWPELSGIQAAPKGDTSALIALASSQEQPAFATSFEDNTEPMPHNTAALFSARGESKRYFKRKPFGAEARVHLAGKIPIAVPIEGYRAGLNICFDSCYPNVMRDTVRLQGADIILLPNMDPVAPFGVIQAIHAAYTPFRAAELGVPIVRADISAYSMIVDGTGRIVAMAESGTEEVIVGKINLYRRTTLYLRWGDWFLYLCGAAALAGLLRSYLNRPYSKGDIKALL